MILMDSTLENDFQESNDRRDDKVYILKVFRKKDAYLLEAVEDGKVVQRTVVKELSLLKHQFEGIEDQMILFWQDKEGDMYIRLKSENHHIEEIALIDYATYSNDIIFRMIANKIYNHTRKKKRVLNCKKAPSHLIQQRNMALATLATAGFGCLAAIFGLSSLDKLELVQPIVQIEAQEEDYLDNFFTGGSIEMVIDQTRTFIDEVRNPSIPVATSYEQAYLYSSKLKEEMESNPSEYVMALYDQPLIPLDLNIHMYNMAMKYGTSYTALIAIAHVESDGNFSNHGVVGCSGDEGYMQINPTNYPVLFTELGYTPEQIKEDDKINVECAAFLLSDICKRNIRRNGGTLNEDEMYREYNGGGNFKIIPATLKYLEYAKRAIDEFYNPDHLIYVKNPEMGVKKC